MSAALISPDWLGQHLDDPGVVIIEVSSKPPAEAEYSKGHIPGARYAFWKDLCWHDTDREFPEPAVMARRLGDLGVGPRSTVVLVGDPIQFATYAFWVLSMTGFEPQAGVLDGGRRTWIEQGRPLTTKVPTIVPSEVEPGTTQTFSRVGRDEVRAGLNRPERVLIDLRTPEEYFGERVSGPTAPFDHGAERKGRIPGARHLFYERLLRPDGTFKDPASLRAESASVGVDDKADVVCYCRLSHRASLGWFALTRLLGHTNVRVYDGSWTEWGSIVGFPVER
ncbi:MAG: sulfurtransferase [Actinomycetota bacterium]|nr:sulfurtransferase [Actinomycetota bacterium]